MGLIAGECRALVAAVRYFTRLPVPRSVACEGHDLAGALHYFPLIGVLVGLVTGSVFLVSLHVLAKPIAVLLAMLVGIFLTGGFHEDGLADTCDGFGGGWTKAQVLAIMKDPRIGSYGVLGLVFGLALKFLLLTAVPVRMFLLVSIAAHAVSRFMALTLVATQRYVREDETARSRAVVMQGISQPRIIYVVVVACTPLAWLGTAGLACAATASVLRWVVGRYFARRIGGYTGDCLGAIQQITEIGFYLAFVAWTSI